MGFFLFGKFIPYYGLCIAVGIVLAFTTGYFLCKRNHLSTNDFIIICAYLIAFGFAGTKILYIFVSFRLIDFNVVFASLKTFNYFMSSGFVFYGGIIGGLFALLFVQKVHKICVQEYFQSLVPSLCIAHTLGRIGCSLAGCCYGKPTDGRFFFMYTRSAIALLNIKLIPVQGIEASFVFCLGIVCLVFSIKQSKVKLERLYLLVYAVLRFVLEFFRGDKERGRYFPFQQVR